MANVYYVYEHWRPDTGVCFYVGKGKNKRAYIMKNRSDHHQKIINKIHKNGMCVEVRLFASGLTESEALEIEKSRISHWRKLGINLSNKTNGGDGISGYKHTPEAKANMSEQRKGHSPTRGTLGMKFSEETRQKMSLAAKGKPKTFEHAAKIGSKHKGKVISAEVRAKMSLAKKGKKQTPEHIAKVSAAIKSWWDKRRESKGISI
jgi:hypothetical protein